MSASGRLKSQECQFWPCLKCLLWMGKISNQYGIDKSVKISPQSREKWRTTLDRERKQSEHISKMIRCRCAFRNFVLLILCLGFWLGLGELITGSCSTITNYYARNYDSNTYGLVVSSIVEYGNKGVGTHNTRYEYEVEGSRYSSNKVSFEANYSDTAHQIVKKYPAGKKVIVYYDSSNPSASILEKTPLGLWNWVQLIGAAIMGLLTFFACRKSC